MLSILFWITAAILWAVADKVETRIAYNTSIFEGHDSIFWCKEIAAWHMPFVPFTTYRPDAWHLSKSIILILMALAILCYKPIVSPLVDFILLGAAWNLVFNIFYNKILLKKTWTKKNSTS